jgi:retinol dehydrogenase-12
MVDAAASRVCLITGASSGLGRATAVELAAGGAHLLLAGRAASRHQPVMDQIAASGGRVEFFHLDLASLESVGSAAEQILSRHNRLDVLINNAGMSGRGVTGDGFELVFGSNYLGHFLLTRLLLKGVRPQRVINLSSDLHFGAKELDWDALVRPTRSMTGFAEYKVSKLCMVLFTTELARRYWGEIDVYAVHPGGVATDIYNRLPQPLRWFVTRRMLSPEQGARTIIKCATDPSLDGKSGGYWAYEQPQIPSVLASDQQLARQLWERSEEWVSAFLP